MMRWIIIALSASVALSWPALADPVGQNPHGKLRWDCQDCHTPRSWHEMRDTLGFSHGETGFALIGAHGKARCASCHRDLHFVRVETNCVDCHTDTHRGQMGTECQSCHTSDDWKNRRDLFVQHAQAGFALVGVHAIADCDACHRSQLPREFAGTATECAGCHGADFEATTNPNHVSAGFSHQCESCHGRTAFTWTKAAYDHPPSFPLTGGHAGLACNNCHSTEYAGMSNSCISCHRLDLSTAKDPNHVTAGFPDDCSRCHTTMAWTPATLDHDLTRFPLTGAHVSVSCNNCHTSGYTGTPAACFACHEKNYRQAPDPNHVTAGFSTECASCHSTAGWSPARFDHNVTGFSLTGAHATVTCNKCHASGFTGTLSACFACHETDYTSAADPKHIAAGFPTECAQCHTTSGWRPANLNHDLTRFPLTGAHKSVTCENCHSAGFTGTSSACSACHHDEYTNTPDPNHVTAGFSTSCSECHTTEGWKPANLDHNLTGFPLTGAHVSVTCANCHKSGYTGTPSACAACHQDDYTGVADRARRSGLQPMPRHRLHRNQFRMLCLP
ncbi:MAG: hypothetical protein HY304_05080 [candidate division Zixibacteria bacterium]|nr:hypothetical protein [candidate division Zixibacteria bacterium]